MIAYIDKRNKDIQDLFHLKANVDQQLLYIKYCSMRSLILVIGYGVKANSISKERASYIFKIIKSNLEESRLKKSNNKNRPIGKVEEIISKIADSIPKEIDILLQLIAGSNTISSSSKALKH
jgi:hypothetical protein